MTETETDNVAVAEAAATALRKQIEEQAGASFVGPDARAIRFTFDRETEHPLCYLTVAMDGFQSSEEASREMFSFALNKSFNVLGNAVRLTVSHGLAQVQGIPQGTLLIWRGEGGTPRFGADADGIWSVQLTYLLLPPFAHVTG